MKQKLKVKPKKKSYAMTRAVKMEKAIMENPVEQNSKNLSAIPKSIRMRREKNTARLEEKVQKMEEDMEE